jgi:hypothetical protein
MHITKYIPGFTVTKKGCFVAVIEKETKKNCVRTCIRSVLESHTEPFRSPSGSLRFSVDLGKLLSQILILNQDACHATFQATAHALVLAS